MAAIVWSDVVAMAPELASIAATTQTDVLAYVNQTLPISLYDGETGPTTRLARIYLAAHLATLTQLGAGGALTGETAGGLSRSYAAPSSGAQLALTAYGQGFRNLRPASVRGPVVL